jgi:hypothetical protein
MTQPTSILTLFAMILAGCGAQQPSAVALTTAPANARPQNDRHVYRFDFVLTSNDGAAPASSTAFSLNLQEFDKGELLIGKNVALPQRQDVGVRMVAEFRMTGDDPLLAVSTELSAFEPPSSVRKVAVKGSALAPTGKSTLVTTLTSDDKQYRLTVTPTMLR